MVSCRLSLPSCSGRPEGLETFGLAQGVPQIEYPRSSVFLQAPFMLSSSVLTRLNAPTLGSLEHSDDRQWGNPFHPHRCCLYRAVVCRTLVLPALMIIGALLAIVWDLWVRVNFEPLCKHFNKKAGYCNPTSRLGKEEGAFQMKRSGIEMETTGQDEGAQERPVNFVTWTVALTHTLSPTRSFRGETII